MTLEIWEWTAEKCHCASLHCHQQCDGFTFVSPCVTLITSYRQNISHVNCILAYHAHFTKCHEPKLTWFYEVRNARRWLRHSPSILFWLGSKAEQWCLSERSAGAVIESKCEALLGQWGGGSVVGFSQPGLLISLIGLGNYLQDPSAYGPTRPSHSYGQDEQRGCSAGRCQHRLLKPQK